jgi:hypothetical protein
VQASAAVCAFEAIKDEAIKDEIGPGRCALRPDYQAIFAAALLAELSEN